MIITSIIYNITSIIYNKTIIIYNINTNFKSTKYQINLIWLIVPIVPSIKKFLHNKELFVVWVQQILWNSYLLTTNCFIAFYKLLKVPFLTTNFKLSYSFMRFVRRMLVNQGVFAKRFHQIMEALVNVDSGLIWGLTSSHFGLNQGQRHSLG